MQALLLEQQDGKTLASVQTLDESRLPGGPMSRLMFTGRA